MYVSGEDLDWLCNAVICYSNKEDIPDLRLIITRELSNLDLYHFGWNIWNHFRVTNQDTIANFLKTVFDSLKDVEQESIKAHLRDDEQRGIIKIQKNLSNK